MTHIRSRYIFRLLAAAFAAVLLLMSLPTFCAVSAADSWGNIDTAERLERAVNEVSASDTARVLDLARALRAMSSREQKRVRGSVIQRLGEYYCDATGYTERVVVENARDFPSGSRIQSGSECYGAALAAQRSVTVYVRQRRATGSSALSFDTDTGGMGYAAPIVLQIALPNRISSTNSYDLRDENGRVASFDIRRGYAVFTAYSDEEYRIVKKSSSAARRARDYDRLDVFWQKVADAVSGAADGYRVNVNIGARREVPADVLRELSGRPVTLLLRSDWGSDIEIYGGDVGAIPVGAEYYTAVALANTYNPRSAARKKAAAAVSSSCATSEQVTPAVPLPAPAPAPVIPVAPVTPRPQSSSVSSIPTVNISGIEMPRDEEDRVPDIEILPEEDVTPSEPQSKPTGTKPGERVLLPESFAMFAAVAVVLAVIIASIVTLIVFIKGKGR